MNEPLPGPYEAVIDIPGHRLLIYADEGERIAMVTEQGCGDRNTAVATACLLAASWELREALEAIEWSRHGLVHGEIQPICAWCDASQVEGHLLDCLIDTALYKARGQVVVG